MRYKVTEYATYYSQWWGRTSPQTDSRQTGLSVKTCLQGLNMVHQSWPDTHPDILSLAEQHHLPTSATKQKLGGGPRNKNCYEHFMRKLFSSQDYWLSHHVSACTLDTASSPKCPHVGQSHPVRLLLTLLRAWLNAAMAKSSECSNS